MSLISDTNPTIINSNNYFGGNNLMYIVEVISGTKTLLREEAQTESEALLLSEKLFAEAHKNFPEFGKTIATCISEGVNE